MALKNIEFTIDNGPSKLDLMLSLFDTDMGAREVEFRGSKAEFHGIQLGRCSVEIVSARRRDPAATIWEIEGRVDDWGNGEKKRARVSICYRSDIREGRMRLEDELQTHGVMETPEDSKRAWALMIIVEKMIGAYHLNRDIGNYGDKASMLVEKAKRVYRASDRDSLAEAIKEI